MKPSYLSPHTAHREVWMLLPWYVNGTLEGDEFNLVQQHLRVCITCHREVVEQQRLAEAISQSGVLDLTPQTSFARLMERIETEGQQVNQRKLGRRRLRFQRAQLSEWLSNVLLPKQVWIAVPIVVLLIALVPAARFWLPSMSTREPQYHTLVSPDSVPAAGANEIRVVLAKTIDSEQIRQLLLSLNGEIVAGPSSAGAYTVRIATSDHSNKELLAVLNRLRHYPGVLLVEPLEPVLPPDRRPGSGR